MKKIFLFAAATAVALSSCSKNEVTTSNGDKVAVDFGAYAGVSTKAAVTVIPDAEEFNMGVFGFYTDGTNWTGTSETPNFMYNQKVTTSDGGTKWTYSPIKYWPNQNDDKISFFAYAPYIETGATDPYCTLTDADATGTPTATFNYQGDFDLTNTTDFVAGNAINQTQATNASTGVEFTLKHELTRVALSVKLAAEVAETANTTVVVKSIEFSGKKVYNNGVYTFNAETGKRGSWVLTAADETNGGSFEMITYMNGYNDAVALGAESDYNESGVLLTTTTAETLNADGATDLNYLFLLPAYLSTDVDSSTTFAAGDVKLTIVYDVVTKDAALPNNSYSAIENTKEFDLTATDKTLEQGVAYSYAATITLKDVTLKASIDEAWGTESEVEKDVVADDSTLSK